MLFSVPSMPDYGRLSKRPLDEMIAGARVEVAPYKTRRAWTSCCGSRRSRASRRGRRRAASTAPGRPGWHIECSAMSWKHLGETFDIHGGGIDLVFPHHENEIAQSRCAFHTPVMANYWMHNGFLQVEGEKMSKSLGNFVTIHELLEGLAGRGAALAMLRTHYRQPIDWTVNGLERERERSLDHWYWTDRRCGAGTIRAPMRARCARRRSEHAARRSPRCTNCAVEAARRRQSGCGLPQGESLQLLGLLAAKAPPQWAACRPAVDGRRRDEGRTALIDARTAARKAKDFEESDRIRDELAAMGVVLKDTKDGTTWEIAR